MEPHAAGSVHRPGDDHQRPRQPLRDVGGVGHGHAGAGVDSDSSCSSYPCEQLHEIGCGDAIYVAPHEPHQFRNPSADEPLGFLCIVDAERDRPVALPRS